MICIKFDQKIKKPSFFEAIFHPCPQLSARLYEWIIYLGLHTALESRYFTEAMLKINKIN